MANESKCGLCPKLGRTALIDEEGHPANHRAKTVLRTIPLRGVGRGDWIRTSDPPTPSVMRYQAALRPDRGFPSQYYRSEEHTTELQSLTSRSYHVYCCKKHRTKQQI